MASASCIAGAALLLALAVLVPALLGYQRYVITSGSMTGTYDRGSLVFDKVVPTSSLRAGDVITFRPPGHAGLVTHRIHTLTSVDGKRVLTTKGDANRVPDAWGSADPQRRAARPAWPSTFPYLGYGLADPQREAGPHARHRPPRAAHRPQRLRGPVARLRPGRASAVGMTRLVVLLAALLAAAAAVQGSQATFTASATNAGASFATASNFQPAVTLTAPANGSATNDTTPTLTGTADNATGDSTSVTIKIYSGSTATGTAVQTLTATRSGTSWSKTAWTLAQGTYTVQATQTDTSGNTGTSNANTFKIDTTGPTATSISAENKAGGTAGKIENGDTLTYTYSEAITPASVWTGWDGASAAVHIKFTSSGNDPITILNTANNASAIHLGSVQTNADYVTATTTFNATMAMSSDGTSVVVTLGTPSNVSSSASPGRNMSWKPKASVKDLAGNAASTTTYTETDTDVDF